MSKPLDILTKFWGYTAFRPQQESIIQSALDGQDTLALLPTGGGKSICYQVPALCREGLCLVVSPLIALMKDQVSQLKDRGIPAAAVYAGMSKRELDIVLENACNGAYKLLYLSPERLQTELARQRIKRMQVNLLAVDEAHCISQWGYDFRPSYLQIATIRKIIPKVPILALTATATAEVVEDIQDKLTFSEPNLVQQSFERSNLSYSVLYEPNKKQKLLDILKNVGGSGLIYVRSRGETKTIASFLRQNRISCDFYHAGLSMEDREQKQEAWMAGKTRIMACTNAFGMGIDKPDVRLVVHLTIPDSIEAYFQEAGRAGRDGKKSYAVLLYAPTDADTLKRFLENAYPDFKLIKRTYQALGSYTQQAYGSGRGESFPFDLQAFCLHFDLEQGPTHAALRVLQQEGWIAITESAGAMPKVHIKANREVLYDYQLRNKKADTITKVLLRAYPGVQHEFSEVSMGALGRFTKLPEPDIIQTLEKAQQAEILDFQPAREIPTLTFLQERVDPEDLNLNIEQFNFRKNRAEERVAKAVQYAESRRCRSRQLLAYFNEEATKDCGICDVCTGRNKTDVSDKLFVSLEKKILTVLRMEALPLEEVLKAFAARRQDQVAQVLGYMLDEEKLSEDEEGLLHISE